MGQTSIVLVGNISNGTWNGTIIATGKIASTLTGKTLTTATLTEPALKLAQSASPKPTTEGLIEWDTNDNNIAVGDGTNTLIFSDDSIVESRANHTGTQLSSTISDFVTAVSATAAVTANTAKITNQTHTGDVTGSGVLIIANGAVDLKMLSASGTPSSTNYLRGDNTWAIPPGGGGQGDMVLASVQTVTGAKTFGTIGGDVGKFILAGSTSGSIILNATAIAGSTTIILPAVNGTISLLENKLSDFTNTTSAELRGVISDKTGIGTLVFSDGPILAAPFIANLTNANHNHSGAAYGGKLSNSALTAGSYSAITGLGTQTANLDMGGKDIDNVQNTILDLSTSGTDIDFSEDQLQQISISANTTFTGKSYAIGKSKILKITTDATQRTLTFPTAWKFLGDKPANQAASKIGVLSLTCFSAVEGGIIAVYAVEE